MTGILQENNLVPRVASVLNMAAVREKKTGFLLSNRHFENREAPGNKVGGKTYGLIWGKLWALEKVVTIPWYQDLLQLDF